MRVSSLSDPRIIELISKYFVPSWASRDHYQIEGDNTDEKTELERLDRDRHQRGLKGGTVCVFIVAPNGDVMATMPVQQATNVENLLPFLEKIVTEHKLKPRYEEAIRASAAKDRQWQPKSDGGRIIHIWTRQDSGPNNGLSNDRVELTTSEWQSFLPHADDRVGSSWQLPQKISQKLFQYCYPPNSSWVAKDCKVLKATLKATLEEMSGAQSRIRLEGAMELSYPHGKPNEGRITAHFVGVARVERTKGTLTALELLSEDAAYVWYWQGKPSPRKMRIALELEP